jgi:ParB/RepB/Spo0J family partition protein
MTTDAVIAPPPERELGSSEISIDAIEPSKTNPKARLSGPQFDELTDSIRAEGVLEPILVRFLEPGRYRVVFGSRRLAAAKAAGLLLIPALVRSLTDEKELEIQLIENLHRQDLHPLEEAEGYHQLSRKPGYDVAKIASRVGRSPKYVYDRIKLLALTKEAKEHFLEGRVTAGHAILLARLTPEHQARALDPKDEACFQVERVADLFAPAGRNTAPDRRHDGLKARSVRELEAWIARNVRFEPERDADPMLFPETAAKLEAAKKVVPITFANYIPELARDAKVRTFFPQSWARADGEKGDNGKPSKTCECSVLGYVAAGPHRGDSFAVCVAKEKCEVHWGDEIRARRRRAQQATKNGSTNKKASAERAEKQGEDQWARARRINAEQSAQWEGARPLLQEAIDAAIGKVGIGVLRTVLIELLGEQIDSAHRIAPAKGLTADRLVRDVVRALIGNRMDEGLGYEGGRQELAEVVASLGVEAEAIVAQAEVQTSAQPGACRECGCTEDDACEGGCAWADETKTLCTSCDPKRKTARARRGAGGVAKKKQRREGAAKDGAKRKARAAGGSSAKKGAKSVGGPARAARARRGKKK